MLHLHFPERVRLSAQVRAVQSHCNAGVNSSIAFFPQKLIWVLAFGILVRGTDAKRNPKCCRTSL